MSGDTAILNPNLPIGGAEYPFLTHFRNPWFIESLPVDDDPGWDYLDEKPTLRWVNGNHVLSLHMTDVTTEQFFEAAHLELDLKKGPYVLSKRVSRIMRPYFIHAHIEPDIVYCPDFDPKVWDGAGLVSRGFLLRMIDHLPSSLPPRKKRQMIDELKHGDRFEFTVMTARGQDKGHAIVVENAEHDFYLPLDTKGEVRMTQGAWVGIVPVHGADDMRIDAQSLINLYPFFNQDNLMEWLKIDGLRHQEAVTSGDMAEVMASAMRHKTTDEINWWLPEYFLSGGQTMWFGSVVKALMKQHIIKIESRKLRIPIPGGRYYIMPDEVGLQANKLAYGVCKGHAFVDGATIWVNQKDWCAYIASVTGGADNDDAYWVHPFRDYDGTQKLLCWRSPNQAGEYIILKPESSLDLMIGWKEWPRNDSRKLVTRIDKRTVTYQNLVCKDEDMGSSQPYTIEVMDTAIQRSIENAGCLGQYCNQLMLSQAITGDLPPNPPAPLEDVIDASVKTGDDLSLVKEWCLTYSATLVNDQVPVPECLVHRLSGVDEEDVTIDSDHWMTRLIEAIDAHLEEYDQMARDLAEQACPPIQVFQAAYESGKLADGEIVRKAYTQTIRNAINDHCEPTPEDFELARSNTLNVLNKHEDRHSVLIATLARCYMARNRSDAVCWQQDATAEDMIAALRKIDVLSSLADMYGHIIEVPPAIVTTTATTAVHIQHVWFNFMNVQLGRSLENGNMRYMSQLPPGEIRDWKNKVNRMNWDGRRLRIETDGNGRQAIYTEHGNLFGYLPKDGTCVADGNYTIQFAIPRNGEIFAIIA